MNNAERTTLLIQLFQVLSPALSGYFIGRLPTAETDPDGKAFEDYFLLIQEIYAVPTMGQEEYGLRVGELKERLVKYGLSERLVARP